MSIHNIQYYFDLWEKYQFYKSGNQERSRRTSYCNPHQLILNPLADLTTEVLLRPTKLAYHTIEKCFVTTTGLLSRSLSQRVSDTFRDPISTKNMQRIGRVVRFIARPLAKRTPVSVPFFHFFDRAMIAAAQHCYIVTTDLIELLDFPDKLHNFIQNGAEEAKESKTPATYMGRAWHYVKLGTSHLKDAVYQLIEFIVDVAKTILQDYPRLDAALQRVGEYLEDKRARIYSGLVRRAHDLVDLGEKNLRHRVAAKVAHVATHKSLRFTIGTALNAATTYGTYLLAKQGYMYYTGDSDFPSQWFALAGATMKVAGVVLWGHFLIQALNDLKKDYRPDFNPETSALTELSNLLSRRNIAPLVAFVKKKLHQN